MDRPLSGLAFVPRLVLRTLFWLHENDPYGNENRDGDRPVFGQTMQRLGKATFYKDSASFCSDDLRSMDCASHSADHGKREDRVALVISEGPCARNHGRTIEFALNSGPSRKALFPRTLASSKCYENISLEMISFMISEVPPPMDRMRLSL